MNQVDFSAKIAEQYEDLASETLTLATEFRNVEGYSSITALSIIMMIDEEFGITINGSEMKECRTIGDLFNLVKSKK